MKKDMEKIVALCKRRGFVFQSSDIHGGVNGFWDYGPLGVELKRNVREAWYRDMITLHDEFAVPEGAPSSFQMTSVETSIIMHPHVWKVSGHYDLFADEMQTCRQCKKLFRADHVWEMVRESQWFESLAKDCGVGFTEELATVDSEKLVRWVKKKGQRLAPGLALVRNTEVTLSWLAEFWQTQPGKPLSAPEFLQYLATEQLNATGLQTPCPNCGGDLTEPRDFNLMFETHLGALQDDKNKAFLRPETAQGMFVNFKNVLDSTRLRVPFGIAQIGKSFRNEITPRNFTFRSREFEQMEMEFFCPPDESRKWYEYWRDRRYKWYVDHGLSSDNLILRDHADDELSHYSVGTADVEYAFPFLDDGEYGELEGIAHRGDFDLRSHAEGKLVKDENGCLVVEKDEHGQPKYRGSGKDLSYFDDEAFERDKERLGFTSFKQYVEARKDSPNPRAPYQFVPHVIEPAAGADRATLAFICEAYHEDEAPDDKGKMQTRTVLRFHPRLAPVKAAVFPLVKKDGMPEKAQQIYRDLRAAGINAFYDQQGAVGRRYRRQDEIGTPWCITVDGETATDGTVTIRDRDTLEQERVKVEDVVDLIARRLRS